MEKQMIILIGIQASGKTTFYNNNFLTTFVHISLDLLHTRNKEMTLLRKSLEEGKNIVIDNTNPTRQDRERYITLAREYGYTVKGYFFQSIIEECVKRNELREGKAKVPSCAIACTSNKLELPEISEGFDELFLFPFNREYKL